MKQVLLLNASHEILRVIPLKRAVVLVLQEKAEVVEAGSEYVRSAYFSMPMPSVIRLKYFVRIPYHAKVALNRKALVARDRGVCQYCGKNGTTIDHIIPRARWKGPGPVHQWTNVALACSPCNQKKGHRLLSELGWTLRSKPDVPRVAARILIGVAEIDPAWEPHFAVA